MLLADASGRCKNFEALRIFCHGNVHLHTIPGFPNSKERSADGNETNCVRSDAFWSLQAGNRILVRNPSIPARLYHHTHTGVLRWRLRVVQLLASYG
jgi:hypothetical protein